MCYEREYRFLKNQFTFSVYDVCTTKIRIKREAFINPMGSLIEQIDLFEYTSDDVNFSIHILDELIDKISLDEEASIMLGCRACGDCDIIHDIRCDIHSMFYKLQRNYNDIASSNDDNKRKVEYTRLLKGFRLIAEVLRDSDFSMDVVAACIVSIRESSKHCMSNWKLTLIGFIVNFEPHIKKMLEQRGKVFQKKRFINDEEDRIYDLLLNAFYRAKNSVTADLISIFIERSRVLEGENTHYRDVCTNFLNREYNMNLPELNDVSENLFSSTLIANIEDVFRKYVERMGMEELIFDKAMKNCIDDIKEHPQKINQVMNWFYMYLRDKGMMNIQKDDRKVYDFIDSYVTYGEYSCKLRYAALKEMMVYYGFVDVCAQNKINFKIGRVIQKLLEVDKNNVVDKNRFKRDVVSILGENLDTLIKFISYPVVMSYNMFGIEDIQSIFIDKSRYNTWLQVAAMCGNNMIVRYLVENGADVNSVDDTGFTVCMYACESGNREVIKYLLECGVDINKEDNNGRTVLSVASSKNYCDVVTYLLRMGADVNTKDFLGWSPIIIACNNNNMELVVRLVKYGADVDAVGEESCTALMYACDRENMDIVRYLVERRVDVNRKNSGGWTALLIACKKNNLELVQYLVEHGSDINCESNVKCTALMIACEQNNMHIVRYLVERGADVNRKSTDGWTALLVASKNDNTNIVVYLVEHGADVNYKDSNDITALSIVCKNNNVELMKYLVENFANISMLGREDKFKINVLVCNDNEFKVNISVDIQHSIQSKNIDKLTKCLDKYMIELSQNEEIKLWEVVNCINYLDGNKLSNEFGRVVYTFKKCMFEYMKRKILNIVPLNRKRIRYEVEHRRDKNIKLK